MDDIQAIHRMKHADIGGLEILVTRYQVKAVRTAFLITHDESMAEDVVQDTFIRIFQRIRQFDENRLFEPYFMRCVVNAALNAVQKKAKWTQDDSGTNMDELEALLVQAASVEEQVEFVQLKGEILAALDRLSSRQRAAVIQRYYLGMSEMEMVDTLEAAPGTVKWLLNAARSRLREILHEKERAMNNQDTFRVLNAVARDYVPEEINLLPRILSSLEKKNDVRLKSRRINLALIVLVTLLVLVMAAINIPAVAEALQHLFGYIPGVGLVDRSAPIRVLREPVVMTRGGVTLTVSEAILSADKTVLVVDVKGVPLDAYPASESDAGCPGMASLRLPDGTLLEGGYIRGGNWSFFQRRLEFGPVPASVNEARLLVDCIGGTIPGRLPEKWEVPMHFVLAPPEMTFNPVFEISPSPSQVEQTGIPTLSQPFLTLEKYVELEDGYILIGAIHTVNLPDGLTASASDQISPLKITDAKGQAVAFEPTYDIQIPGSTVDYFPWAYKIQGKQFAWPLTITLADAIVRLPEQEMKFPFDTGPAPKTGQEWIMNTDVEMNGYNARLVSIRRLADGYTFKIQFGPQVDSVGAWFDGANAIGGGGGPDDQGFEELDETYASTPPEGKLTVVLSIQTVSVLGPWSVTWEPDVLPTAARSLQTTQSSVCVTEDNLYQLAPVPANMTGKALLYQKLVESGTWGVALANLDDSQRKVVASNGNWPALSPDGTRVVYSYDVLYMDDLRSGKVTTLPGTGGNDYNPLWSPDGKWIAFINSVNGTHISLIAPDGTRPRRLYDNSNHGALAGWSPDGMQLYFTAPGLDGWTLYAIDLATSAVKTLFVLEDASLKAPNAAVSPDGAWIAYRDRVMNVYLVRMDGTERHLVASGPVGISTIVWSGDWLGFGVGNFNAEDTLVLLQPQTCQAFILPELHGTLEGLQYP